MDKNRFRVIGLMSGTSMDGVDIAYCIFNRSKGHWEYKIEEADTISYDDAWLKRLTSLHSQTALEYAKTDMAYGTFLGTLVTEFITRRKLQPDLISSHGHTIFHQPGNGFTAQIGNGSSIHATTGLPVVSDFRTLDVALGGQGAPLVPMGDELLFNEYDACLNFGGIVNISYRNQKGAREAFDISPCNMILNRLANKEGVAFDKDGLIAGSGKVDTSLLHTLNQLSYYQIKGAKSLGIEWVDAECWPLINKTQLSVVDQLATCNAHISDQIYNVISEKGIKKVLCTGGGTYNKHLLQLLRDRSDVAYVIPENRLINYKEALVFAFLGVLRILNLPNVWKSYTGASRDSVSGVLIGNVLF